MSSRALSKSLWVIVCLSPKRKQSSDATKLSCIIWDKQTTEIHDLRVLLSFAFLQALCAKGAYQLQSKSVNVQDAANELINMLVDIEEEEEEEEEDYDDAELDRRK